MVGTDNICPRSWTQYADEALIHPDLKIDDCASIMTVPMAQQQKCLIWSKLLKGFCWVTIWPTVWGFLALRFMWVSRMLPWWTLPMKSSPKSWRCKTQICQRWWNHCFLLFLDQNMVSISLQVNAKLGLTITWGQYDGIVKAPMSQIQQISNLNVVLPRSAFEVGPGVPCGWVEKVRHWDQLRCWCFQGIWPMKLGQSGVCLVAMDQSHQSLCDHWRLKTWKAFGVKRFAATSLAVLFMDLFIASSSEVYAVSTQEHNDSFGTCPSLHSAGHWLAQALWLLRCSKSSKAPWHLRRNGERAR